MATTRNLDGQTPQAADAPPANSVLQRTNTGRAQQKRSWYHLMAYLMVALAVGLIAYFLSLGHPASMPSNPLVNTGAPAGAPANHGPSPQG